MFAIECPLLSNFMISYCKFADGSSYTTPVCAAIVEIERTGYEVQ